MIAQQFFTLNNGTKIPKIGFGTWQIADSDAYDCVSWALEAGYRHIDTAYVYGNEKSVGKAINNSGLKREDIYLTTKLPSDIKSYEGALEYFERSRENLQAEYVDLYLIHAPWPWSAVGTDCTQGNIEAWQGLIQLQKQGVAKSIGVSNFSNTDISAIINATGVVPQANQIRYFIGNTQPKITNFCQEKGILVQAYSPLATGELLSNPILLSLAEKYNKSIAKICIRYCLEKGTLPIPKSTHKHRIIDNLDVDFELSKQDLEYLDNLYHIASAKAYRS